MPNPQVYEAGSPFSRAVRDYSDAQGRYAGEEWKRYLGVLNGARLQAQGPGIGATRGLLPRPGDEDILRSNAANAYAASLTDENRMRAQTDRDMAAHNEQVDAAERGRQTAERALAIANDPNTSQFGRPIVGGNGSYATSREPVQPGNPQALAAQMAPGLIAPPAAAAKVTYGDPKTQMVDGKRRLVRAGSDGLMYGMDRKPIDPEKLAPLDPEADSAKPYFTYQATFDPQGRPTGAIRFDARGGPPVKVNVEEITGGQLKPPPGTTGTQALVNEASTQQLDRLKTMFDSGAKDLLGPIEGRARSIGQQIPGVPVNKTFSDFNAASAAFRNSVIKAITGAAMGEKEADRIMKQIPSETDKPDVWLSKYEQSRKNLADLDAVLANKGGGAGGGAPKRIRYDMDGNPIK